jgi:hypothetical protein
MVRDARLRRAPHRVGGSGRTRQIPHRHSGAQRSCEPGIHTLRPGLWIPDSLAPLGFRNDHGASSSSLPGRATDPGCTRDRQLDTEVGNSRLWWRVTAAIRTRAPPSRTLPRKRGREVVQRPGGGVWTAIQLVIAGPRRKARDPAIHATLDVPQSTMDRRVFARR